MSRADRVGKPLWLDIRDYSPDYIDVVAAGVDGSDLVENRRESANVYHHINFMIHLLWDIPYHAEDSDDASVHGRVDRLAEAMRDNLTREFESPDPRSGGWPSQLGAAARIMPGHLNGILQLPSVTGGVTVK
jgi:hypothetical protein